MNKIIEQFLMISKQVRSLFSVKGTYWSIVWSVGQLVPFAPMGSFGGTIGYSFGANGDVVNVAPMVIPIANGANGFWRCSIYSANGDRHWRPLDPIIMNQLWIHSMAILNLQSPLRVNELFGIPMAPVVPMATMEPMAIHLWHGDSGANDDSCAINPIR